MSETATYRYQIRNVHNPVAVYERGVISARWAWRLAETILGDGHYLKIAAEHIEVWIAPLDYDRFFVSSPRASDHMLQGRTRAAAKRGELRGRSA